MPWVYTSEAFGTVQVVQVLGMQALGLYKFVKLYFELQPWACTPWDCTRNQLKLK